MTVVGVTNRRVLYRRELVPGNVKPGQKSLARKVIGPSRNLLLALGKWSCCQTAFQTLMFTPIRGWKSFLWWTAINEDLWSTEVYEPYTGALYQLPHTSKSQETQQKDFKSRKTRRNVVKC